MLERLVDFGKKAIIVGSMAALPFISGCSKKALPTGPTVTPTTYALKVQCASAGVPVSGAELSVYPVSTYDADINPELLIPKSTPDAISDSSGSALLNLSQASHIVVKSGTKSDILYNVQPPAVSGGFTTLSVNNAPNVKNADLTENSSCDVEGNIVHQEVYDEIDLTKGNKYAIGDKLEFRLRRVNSSCQATFLVERQDGIKEIVYKGSLTPSEAILSSDLNKSKNLEWLVNKGNAGSLNGIELIPGKYKLYSSIDGNTENKLIGVFFVKPGATSTVAAKVNTEIITSHPSQVYTGDEFDIKFTTRNVPVDGTVASDFYTASSVQEDPSLITSFSGHESADYVSRTAGTLTLRYDPTTEPAGKNSGNKTIIISSVNPLGVTKTADVNVKVNVNDDEAYEIMKKECENRALFDVSTKDTHSDTLSGVGGQVSGNFDVFSNTGSLNIEYFKNPEDLTQFDTEEQQLLLNWTASNDSNRARGIAPGTATEVETKISQILTNLGY